MPITVETTNLSKSERLSVSYYSNGVVYSESYYKNDKPHRQGEPAQKFYYPSGSVMEERYYTNGKLDRKDGPANLFFDEYGHCIKQNYYENGFEKLPSETKHLFHFAFRLAFAD